MFRNLLSSFTATHVTIMFVAALFVPGALYAVPSFTNVAVMDPVSGYRASVDPSRRVLVRDPVTEFASNPANFVDFDAYVSNNSCGTVYTIPTGKALVVTAVTGDFSPYTSGTLGYSIYANSGCSGSVKIANYTNSTTASPIQQSFETGVAFPAGVVSLQNYNQAGYIIITGYLVPADTVTAAAPAASSRKGLPPGRAF